MNLELKRDAVLLCEGKADQAFFKALCQARHLPEFDMLPPSERFSGTTNFDKMLQALQGDSIGFQKIKGIIIIADSADNPENTFQNIIQQVKNVPGFGIPLAPSVVALGLSGYPAIMISLLPSDDVAGGLESLFVSERFMREPWIESCVNNYLSSGNIDALKWSPEKLGKARYHSLVAARNKDDPSRSASYAFKNPPFIDINGVCFNSISATIKKFCLELDIK